MGDSHVGLQARLMSQALRKLAGHAQPHGHDLHLHEPAAREDRRHVREPGDDSRAAVRSSSTRRCASTSAGSRRSRTARRRSGTGCGSRSRRTRSRRRSSRPSSTSSTARGIPWEGTVLDVALEKKVVQKAGSYFSFGDERLGQGRQNATSFLSENPDLVQQILGPHPGRGAGLAGHLRATAPLAGACRSRVGRSRGRGRGRGTRSKRRFPSRAESPHGGGPSDAVEAVALAGCAIETRSARPVDALPRGSRVRRKRASRGARHA